VKKLAENPATPAAPAAAPPISPEPAFHNGPGAGSWQNMTLPLVANSSRPAYAAVVDAGGIQMTAFCHSGKDGHFVVPGLRVTGADPRVSARLSQGLASAPSISNDLSSVDMTFADGTAVPGAAATAVKDNEVTLYVDRKLLKPEDEVLERLMAGETVTITAQPFAASFQLDGSRAALCSVLNRCGAKIEGCDSAPDASPSCDRGQYRNSKGRCIDKEDGADEKINCGRGRTWVGARGACVCIDGDASWNGSRCVPRRVKKNQACTGGRTIDPQSGRCDCNGDSVWNGRACVKENEPPPSGGQNNNPQTKKAVCAALQIACSLGQKNACNNFNGNCR
jgi:hypothetical protein